MLLEFFENLASDMERRLGASPATGAAEYRFAREAARLGARIVSRSEKIAWCSILTPFDLLTALGATGCFVEVIGAVLSRSEAVKPLLEEAEHAGYSTDSCSYHRAAIGAALKGLIPPPDFLVGVTGPCTGGLATIENLSRHFGCDYFVLDLPCASGEKEVQYTVRQMESLALFVSARTGVAIERARLGRAMELTNEAREAMLEIYEIARALPSPIGGAELRNFGLAMSLFLGSEAAVEIARAYRDEFRARLERQGRTHLSDPRKRLLWVHTRLQVRHPVTEALDDNPRAYVVAEEFNDITWEPIDPADPFTGLARRALSIPFIGPIERRIERLQDLARAYRVDGAIHPCHWGCRQSSGGRGLIEAGLKKIGVPVLNLEVDCADPRNFAEGQIRTRLEAFLEMLGATAPCQARPNCGGATQGFEATPRE